MPPGAVGNETTRVSPGTLIEGGLAVDLPGRSPTMPVRTYPAGQDGNTMWRTGRLEVCSRYLTGAAVLTQTFANQLLKLTFFYPLFDCTINSVESCTTATAAAATPTLCRMGIYQTDATFMSSLGTAGNLNLIGACASDTTIWSAANTLYDKPLVAPASVQLFANTLYAAAGLCVTGVAAPTFVAVTYSQLTFPAALNLAWPPITRGVAGQSDLPASIAFGSLANAASAPYFSFGLV